MSEANFSNYEFLIKDCYYISETVLPQCFVIKMSVFSALSTGLAMQIFCKLNLFTYDTAYYIIALSIWYIHRERFLHHRPTPLQSILYMDLKC